MSTQAPAIRSVHDTEGAAVIDAFMRPYETDTPLIRMGDFGDGGYLLPDDLRGIAACYSPGVSEQASFEMDMAKRGIASFMADASVERPPLNVPGAEFLRKFLGDKDEGEVMTLASWVAATDPDPDADLLLQMDIEGAEYATLSAAPRDLLRRFRMIVIEWHHLPSILTKPRFMGPALAAIEKLREDFVTVHLHPTTCRAASRSTARRSRAWSRRRCCGATAPTACARRPRCRIRWTGGTTPKNPPSHCRGGGPVTR